MQFLSSEVAMNIGLWWLSLIAICNGFNMSDHSSAEFRVQNRRNDLLMPEIIKIRYHHGNQIKLVALKKVSDSTLTGLDTPIWFIGSDGSLSTEQKLFTNHLDVPIFYHGVNGFSSVTYFLKSKTLYGILEQEVYIEGLPLIYAHNPESVNSFIHPIPNEMDYLQHFRNIRGTDRKRKFDGEPISTPRKRFRGNDQKKMLYPEIFLIVDVSPERIDRRLPNQYGKAVAYIIAYWNAIDMLFRNLKYVDIKLNIAGMIVTAKQDLPNSGLLLPGQFRADDTDLFISKLPALNNLGSYFLHGEIIDRSSYDFLIWMTSATLVDNDVRYTEIEDLHSMKKEYIGAAVPSDCGGLHDEEVQIGMISNRAVVMYDDNYSQYHTAARELAHLMFIFDDDVEVSHGHHHSNCLTTKPMVQSSGIMDPTNKRIGDYLLWSYCSEIHFEKYSRSKSSCCLINYPYRTMDPPEPIHYTSIESQCGCYGKQPHDTTMYYGRNICAGHLRCKNNKGRSVVVGMPLDGTPCVLNDQQYGSFCRYQECS